MKTLYFIGGPMGVGKTTVGQLLKRRLDRAVFLDGDWCWDADPFQVTDETKQMVTDNICHLLNGFIRCSAYRNIVFCWVMHDQAIVNGILARLELSDCAVRAVSLVCAPEALRERLEGDIRRGVREADVVERSLARLPLYDGLNTVKIDTTGLSPEEIAGRITGWPGHSNILLGSFFSP